MFFFSNSYLKLGTTIVAEIYYEIYVMLLFLRSRCLGVVGEDFR